MERDLIRTRTAEGRCTGEGARAAYGRPPKLTPRSGLAEINGRAQIDQFVMRSLALEDAGQNILLPSTQLQATPQNVYLKPTADNRTSEAVRVYAPADFVRLLVHL